MSEFYKAINTGDLANGEMKNIEINRKDVLIAREGDEFYASTNKCPHLGGKLSKGDLDGHVVTCPLHKSKFNLKTGEVIQWTDFSGVTGAIAKAVKKPKPLKVFKVEVKEKDVMVEL